MTDISAQARQVLEQFQPGGQRSPRGERTRTAWQEAVSEAARAQGIPANEAAKQLSAAGWKSAAKEKKGKGQVSEPKTDWQAAVKALSNATGAPAYVSAQALSQAGWKKSRGASKTGVPSPWRTPWQTAVAEYARANPGTSAYQAAQMLSPYWPSKRKSKGVAKQPLVQAPAGIQDLIRRYTGGQPSPTGQQQPTMATQLTEAKLAENPAAEQQAQSIAQQLGGQAVPGAGSPRLGTGSPRLGTGSPRLGTGSPRLSQLGAGSPRSLAGGQLSPRLRPSALNVETGSAPASSGPVRRPLNLSLNRRPLGNLGAGSQSTAGGAEAKTGHDWNRERWWRREYGDNGSSMGAWSQQSPRFQQSQLSPRWQQRQLGSAERWGQRDY